MSKPAQVTPQGPTQDVIGGGIAAGVVRQLIQREELVSQGQKSKEHLLFFNGNGAWARMVSSVNTLTETETNQLAAGKALADFVRRNSALGRCALAIDVDGNGSDRTQTTRLHDP